MNTWIYLTFAILSEVIATASLKSTEGFTKLWPSLVVLVGYSAAFYFLSLTLEDIPIGVAYAVWSGVGVATITIVSVVFMDQKIDLAGVLGIGLIVIGVIILRLYRGSSVEAGQQHRDLPIGTAMIENLFTVRKTWPLNLPSTGLSNPHACFSIMVRSEPVQILLLLNRENGRT